MTGALKDLRQDSILWFVVLLAAFFIVNGNAHAAAISIDNAAGVTVDGVAWRIVTIR